MRLYEKKMKLPYEELIRQIVDWGTSIPLSEFIDVDMTMDERMEVVEKLNASGFILEPIMSTELVPVYHMANARFWLVKKGRR